MGGISTSFVAVKANLALSVAVATTGICLPVALSFSLLQLTNVTPLQAFAAGASLCSTSLATTFTVLSTSGLKATRLGTVLATAAMLDDIVGLVLVQVISNLGDMSASLSSITVVRPIAVSIGLVVGLIIICRFMVKPVTFWLAGRMKESTNIVPRFLLLHRKETVLVIHTTNLMVMVAGSSYAGTSNLLAAYLAGASISWWESEVSCSQERTEKNSAATARNHSRHPGTREGSDEATGNDSPDGQEVSIRDEGQRNDIPRQQFQATYGKDDHSRPGSSGASIYEEYYATIVQRLLKPFFFASIAFSIPITKMFSSSVVWRGLVYTLLMLLGKMLTGLWLVRFPILLSTIMAFFKTLGQIRWHCGESRKTPTSTTATVAEGGATSQAIGGNPGEDSRHDALKASVKPLKPLSLYPASVLGTAMVSRGEIGFLIASVAESRGIFANNTLDGKTTRNDSSEIFLIVIWAITLCTIIGPLGVGLLVRRVRTLQGKEPQQFVGRGPLGTWGVR
jgi:Kef-type K+ transport system membrane component KefB